MFVVLADSAYESATAAGRFQSFFMRASHYAGMKRSLYMICAALPIAAVLGGCAAGAPSSGSAIPAAGTHLAAPRMRVGAHGNTTAVVYIANLSPAVSFYSADIHEHNPPLLGEITDGVSRSQWVWLDRHRVLYVVNNGGSSPSIEEYKPGSVTPFKSITKGLFIPGAVVVDRRGTLYVDNNNGYQDLLEEYADGSSSPTKIIMLPVIDGQFYALAFDPKEDLYLGASGREGLDQFLYEIPKGSTKAKQIVLSGYPGSAIAIDGVGNLYAAGGAGDIAVYKPGATSPSYTANAKDAEVLGIAVTPDGTLYVPSYNGQLFEFAPGATTPTNSFLIVNGATGAAVGTF